MHLTEREKEIVLEVAKGATTYSQLAEKLCTTKSNVNYHLQNLYSKFGVNDITALAVYIFTKRLIKVT